MRPQSCPFRLDYAEFNQFCDDFIENNSQVRAQKSRIEYFIILREFRRWLIEHEYHDFDESIVKEWLLYCSQKASAIRVAFKASVISKFLDFLLWRGVWHQNPFAALRAQHRARGYRGIARILRKTASITALDELADTPFSGPLRDHFQHYLNHLAALGQGFDSQRYVLASFEKFLRKQNIDNWRLIDAGLITDWINHRKPSSAYQHRCLLVILNDFFDFLVIQGELNISPMPPLPPHQRHSQPPYIYTREEIQSILTAVASLPDHRHMPYRGPTYRMVFLTLYTLGLRINEALNLKSGDIDFTQDSITLRETKFHKGRVLPFGPRFKKALERYIFDHPLLRSATKESFLFPTDSGRTPRLANESCYRTLRRILRDLDIKAPPETRSPNQHSFRHSFAVHRIEQWLREKADIGAKLPLLSAFLGHHDAAATQVYLTMTPERLTLIGDRFEEAFGRKETPNEED